MSKTLEGHCLLPYYGWLVEQSEYALWAHSELLNAVKGKSSASYAALIQAMLTATANISKLFCPSDARCELLRDYTKKRGRTLKTIFGLKDGNIIFNKKMRNHFEHYDERLDHLVGLQDCSSFVTTNQIPVGANPVFDPGSMTVKFRDDQVDMNQLAKEIKRIRNEAKKKYFELSQQAKHPSHNSGPPS